MTPSPHYAARLEKAALAALTGLLADPEDHADECQPGETCREAVARLAVEQAREVIKAIDREVALHDAAEMLAKETRP
jgi:hypothetical protein